MKALKIAGVLGLAVAVLALLWLDVSLAFQFGIWTETTFGSTESRLGGGGIFLGLLAFVVIVGVEAIAGYWIYLLILDQEGE